MSATNTIELDLYLIPKPSLTLTIPWPVMSLLGRTYRWRYQTLC